MEPMPACKEFCEGFELGGFVDVVAEQAGFALFGGSDVDALER